MSSLTIADLIKAIQTSGKQAEVFNGLNVGVYPVKGQPGKHTTTFIDADGKRRFMDRVLVEKEDGTQVWKWRAGKALAPREEAPVAVDNDAVVIA